MKIGMPSLIEFNNLEQNINLCKQLDFDFIELNMNFPYNMINVLKYDKLKVIAKENNIEFTMHMPDNADIGSLYDDIRDGYVNLFLKTLKWCKQSNVRLINMHIPSGAYMTLPDRKIYIYDKYADLYINNFLESLSIISDVAVNCDTLVCIENSSNFDLKYVKEIIYHALKLDNIRLTWDTGHDYINKFEDQKLLLLHKEKICHMHLHDANKTSDHRVLYDGDLDIEELFKFAQINDISTLIEVKTAQALKQSAEAVKQHDLINKI